MKWLDNLLSTLFLNPELGEKFANKNTRQEVLKEIISSPRDELSGVDTSVGLTEEQQSKLMDLPDAKNMDALREDLVKLIESEKGSEGGIPRS